MRLRSLIRFPLVIAAIFVTILALAAPAFANEKSTTVHLDGGHTALTLDEGTAGVLADNGVSVAPIDGAEAEGRTFTFPITGGRVDSETVAGTIEHSGGIRFSAGDTTLSVEDFVIDTEDGVLTARVSGTETRIPLLDLDLSDASIDRDDGRVVVSDVRATLTGDAAGALNKTFDTTLFSEGLKIGDATVTAKF